MLLMPSFHLNINNSNNTLIIGDHGLTATVAIGIIATLSSYFALHKYNKHSYDKKKKKSDEKEEERRCIYLDYNGTTPIYDSAYTSMIPYFKEHFGNPSSSHCYGLKPREAIQNARISIAKLLRKHTNTTTTTTTDHDEKEIESLSSNIIFTGCGTESNNLAIYLAIRSYQQRHDHHHNEKHSMLPHVITTNVEHAAILECLKYYEYRKEITVTYIPVDSHCVVSAAHVEAAITKSTCLVTIMYANNEIGSIMPIMDIAKLCKSNQNRNILFHTDAAQCIGKTSSFEFDPCTIDMLTLVGHKIGAPKGVAALYIRKDFFEPASIPYLVGQSGGILLGGGQEFGYRGGTENVPYIVALGNAVEIIIQEEENYQYHYTSLIQTLSNLLKQNLGEENLLIHGPTGEKNIRLSNTLSIGIRHIHSGILLQNISSLVAASSGSACHSTKDVSDVLKAMNVPLEYALGTIRLSVGFDTTLEDVRNAARIISDEVHRLWKVVKVEKA